MDELNIPLTIGPLKDASPQAVEAIKSLELSTAKATVATKEGAKEGGVLNEVLDATGRRGGVAHEAFEGLERAARGGEAGIFGLAKALRAMMEAGEVSPLVILIAAISVAGPAIEGLKELFGDTGGDAESMADKFQKSAERTSAIVGEIDKLALEEFRAQLKDAAIEADLLATKAEAAATAAEKIADSEDRLKKATIRNDPTLTNEQKEEGLADVDAKASARKRDGSIKREEEKIEAAATDAQVQAAALASLQAKVDAAAAALAPLTAKLEIIEAARKKFESALQNAGPVGRFFAPYTGGTAIGEEIETKREQTLAPANVISKQLKDAQAAVAEQKKIAATAQAKADMVAATAGGAITAIQGSAPNDDAAAAIEAAAARTAARKKDLEGGGHSAEQLAKHYQEVLKDSPAGKAIAAGDPHLAAAVEAMQKLASEAASGGKQEQIVALLKQVVALYTQLSRDKAGATDVALLAQQLRSLLGQGG